MNFPNIPNIEFKIISGYKSGSRQYAISSDGNVWIGNANRWNKLKPFQRSNGEWAVHLLHGGTPEGMKLKTISELLEESFGNHGQVS